ncbi:protein kinase, ATP binding site-containing protein, partial [Tanacetum coccineum]
MSSSGVNLENFPITLEDINVLYSKNFENSRHVEIKKVYELLQKRKAAIASGNSFEEVDEIISKVHHKNINVASSENFENSRHIISKFHHENIIPFYDENGPYKEYAIIGRLNAYLEEEKNRRNFTWAQRLRTCIDIAKGLSYLHSGVGDHGRVIHAYVHNDNILLNKNLEAKVCGLYGSILVRANQPRPEIYRSTPGLFSTDPVYLESKILNIKSDIYSYDILMFSILTGMKDAYRRRAIGDYKEQQLMNLVSVASEPVGIKQHSNSCFNHHSRKPTIDEKEEADTREEEERLQSPSQRSYKTARASKIPTKVEEDSESLVSYQWNNGKTCAPMAVQKGKKKKVCKEQQPAYYGKETCAYRFIYVSDSQLKDPNKSITWTQRLKISIEVAKGLRYLHSGFGEYQRVIHGNFGSRKILLYANLEAKIWGFSNSFLFPGYRRYYEPCGHVDDYYMDPVYRQSQIRNKESDVYSYGVVLFEILTGMLACETRRIGDEEPLNLVALVRRYYADHMDKLLDPRIRDEIDDRSLYTFKEIAYKCISFSGKDRPSLTKIIKRLEEALYIQ